MRSAARSRRPVPICIASVGPRHLRLTGELADGWIGNGFLPETSEASFGAPRAGARAAARSRASLEQQVRVTLEFDDDLDTLAKRHAEGYAFTFGAMGASNRNFNVEAFARQGFDDVREVHRLWLDGRRDEAQDLVPVEIALKTNLLGTTETVKDRLRLSRRRRRFPSRRAARSGHQRAARATRSTHGSRARSVLGDRTALKPLRVTRGAAHLLQPLPPCEVSR